MKFCTITTILFVVICIFMTIYSAFALFNEEVSGVYLTTDYEIPATIVSYDSVNFARNTRPSNNEVRIVNITGNRCTIVFGKGEDMDFAENVNMVDLRYDGRQVDLISGRTNNFSLEYYATPKTISQPLSQSKWFLLRQTPIVIVFLAVLVASVIYIWKAFKNEVPINEHPQIYFWFSIVNIVLCLCEAAIFVLKIIFH